MKKTSNKKNKCKFCGSTKDVNYGDFKTMCWNCYVRLSDLCADENY